MTPEPADFPRVVLLQVVDSLEVSPRGTRVGLVQYSSRVRTEFPLDMYHTADDIKAAVMKVRIPADPSGSLRIPADPCGSPRIPPDPSGSLSSQMIPRTTQEMGCS